MRDMANKHKTIIMADDDMKNLSRANDSLRDAYNLFTVPSGKTLFLLLECVRPDIILLDTEMPDMSGFKAFEMLKNSTKTARIPVIFLSDGIDPESEKKGLDMGATAYITKPLSCELLSKRVGLHLPPG
jgi:response regulator RpfG family c-di-GMP phosphodiesterase